MSESFLLSNMAPQIGAGFNRGIWKTLEAKVREWAIERGELYVVTGSIYSATSVKHIGISSVTVPTHFYKVITDPVRVEVIAFILPNEKNPSSMLPTFITSVDEVESKTGLDFLSALQDDVENLVEANAPTAMWQ